jgi:hypothetical protein
VRCSAPVVLSSSGFSTFGKLSVTSSGDLASASSLA